MPTSVFNPDGVRIALTQTQFDHGLARTGRLLAGGQRPRGTNLLGRLQAAHETRESVPIAECAQNSRIPRAEQRRQRFAMSVARRESAALGPNRVPIGTSCRLRCWASAQIRHAAQAQTLGDLQCARAMVTVRSPRVIIERIGRIQMPLSSLIHAVYRVG